MSTAVKPVGALALDYVRKLVAERAAIVLEPTKGYLVEARLAPLVRQQAFGSLDELVARLKKTPYGELHELVVDAMTTNETSFFRDIHPFEALRNDVLPEVLRRRAATRTLNVWSAACSSGQEPYTIALLLCEYFPQLAGWNVKIYATDLSREMLERASTGRFNQAEVNRGLPAALLVKYFQREGQHWTVKPDVRRLVTFQRMNLADTWPVLPRMDVIFLRNVLIYFESETKRAILNKMRRQLVADGTLFLGAAETTLGLDDVFQRMSAGRTTVYRPNVVGAKQVVAL